MFHKINSDALSISQFQKAQHVDVLYDTGMSSYSADITWNV